MRRADDERVASVADAAATLDDTDFKSACRGVR